MKVSSMRNYSTTERVRKVSSVLCCAALTLSIFARPVWAEEVLSESKKKPAEQVEKATPDSEEAFKAAEPEETVTGSDNKTLYIIGGALAVGLGAAALGGGGGGSSEPDCELDPVGPDISGKGWEGILNLINHGSQPVSASIAQCGPNIEIRTNSKLPYGQFFAGTMSSSGKITVRDQATMEIWTSFIGVARSNYIKIYDYVNNQEDLDTLEIAR